jgi:hypothetical protein
MKLIDRPVPSAYARQVSASLPAEATSNKKAFTYIYAAPHLSDVRVHRYFFFERKIRRQVCHMLMPMA